MSVDEGKTVAFLYVTDLDASLQFYGDLLGLKIRSRDDQGAFVESAGALVRLTPMPDHSPSPHPVLGWDVADIGKSVRDLAGRGVSFTIYDGMGQDELGIWSTPDGTTKLAWFNDPDGNVLSLSQT